jgi:hypothetical protein
VVDFRGVVWIERSLVIRVVLLLKLHIDSM